MPNFWTHLIGGEMVLKKLGNEDFQEMIINNRKAFDFGCQGPDFLFYNDFWPWIKYKKGPSVGTDIHGINTKALFLTSIDYLKKMKNNKGYPILFSYFCGFLCHYVVDKWCHPFINSKTSNSNEHVVFEIKLDVYFVDKYWNKIAYKLSPTKVIDMGKKLPFPIENYYREIILSLYRPSSEVNYINDSYRDMKKVLSIFYSPYPIKRLGLNTLNTLLPLDISIYMYPTKVDYKFLTEEEFAEFENLFKKGVSEGVELIKLLNLYLNEEIEKYKLNEVFRNVSFGGEIID